MNEAIREQLSAYVDGELPDNEAELLIRRMSQDAELRKEVANYLAIGRVIRDEMGIAAADKLHSRVAAELGEHYDDEADKTEVSVAARSLKPLAGAAIAASVALVAIFMLQTTDGVEEQPLESPVAATTVPSTTSQDAQNEIYLQNHLDAVSEQGANGMNTRVVTLELEEDIEDEAEEETGDEETSDQP